MARLNEQFKANNAIEQRILAYVEENASDVLVERINGKEYKKNIQSCMTYVRNMAKMQAQNGCACIEDSEVFGWVMHFFEEDSIPAVEVPKADEKKEQPKTEPKYKPNSEVERWKAEPSNQEKKPERKEEQKPKKKPDADVEGQISFADLFGGFEP